MTRLGRISRVMGSLIGIGLALAAAFAYRLGLDSNPDWGPSRKLLLVVGLVLIVASWLGAVVSSVGRSRLWRSLDTGLRRAAHWWLAPLFWARESLRRSRAYRMTAGLLSAAQDRLRQFPIVGYLISEPEWAARIVVLIIWGSGLAYLLWMATGGTWVHWPVTTSDFDLLAQGFLQGHLYLPLKPSAKFLSFADPYGVEAQRYMPPVWDISYFAGRFYLYWGPVPALLAAMFRLISGGAISDGWLTLVFVAGTAGAGAWLLLDLRQGLFPDLPWPVAIPGAILLVGAAPPLWLMSRPAVYEAAIAAGQFFLISGVLCLWPALAGQTPSSKRLVLGAFCLACAVGSRINLLPGVALLVVAVLLAILAKGQWRLLAAAHRLEPVVVPLVVGGGLLGWYNWARFGSILETGHSYQLTGTGGLHALTSAFVAGNAIPNVFNYLLRGVDWLSVFPYIKPNWGSYYIWAAHYYAPKGYYTEQVVGLLLAFPFIWMGIFQLAGVFNPWRRRGENAPALTRPAEKMGPARWVGLTLVAMTVLLAGPLVLYSFASMRYEFDVFPMLTVLATLGFWAQYRAWRPRPVLRLGLFTCTLGLVLLSLAAGFLLAMTGFASNFEKLNPRLFHTLAEMFTR